MNNKANIKLITILSLTVSIVMHTAVFLSFWFGDGIIHNIKRPKIPFNAFFINICFTATLAFILYLYNVFMQNIKMNKTAKIILIIAGSIFITTVLSLTFSVTRTVILHYPIQEPLHRRVRYYRNGLMQDYFITAIVVFSWQLVTSNRKNKRIAIENEKLKAENIRTRFEVLKNQMDPHFIFNSLNTLQSLIITNSNKAQEFVQELSKVLRYTLQDRESVTLDEELRLTASFCNLMQIRYGNNLIINFNIDEELNEYKVVPLGVQMLVENAIKHNVVSDNNPLTINIFTNKNTKQIIVENKLQPKISSGNTNGIGLANLAERYRLKWDKNVEIMQTENNFVVKLILIDEN